MGKQWKQWQTIFRGSKITADGDCSQEVKSRMPLGRKAMTNLGSILKSRDITLPAKIRLVKTMFFPVVMYGCESWTIKKTEHWRCFWTVVLEKTLESPLDCKEIKPVNPTGNQSWIFIGRTDAEAEDPILWPPDAKSWLVGKDPDAGEDWRQEDKGMTEDERVGWHHRLNGHEWASSRSWSWTGKPGVPKYMGSQRVGDNWATELNRNPLKDSQQWSFRIWFIIFVSSIWVLCPEWKSGWQTWKRERR